MAEDQQDKIIPEPKVVQDPGEVALVLRSDLKGRPIGDLSFLRRALLFAELAMIAYNDKDEATRAAKLIGFEGVELYDRDGAEAYRFSNEHDCVIACRGTEPTEWNDVKADADAVSDLAETVGRVHRGFKREVDDLWPMIEEDLVENTKTLYFCGHSLGAAMATICAGRCELSHIKSNPAELQTFGSPRVGNKRYVNHTKLNYFRWVNNNDLVTRVPPAWMGYRHTGEEKYLDYQGRLRKLNGLKRMGDRFRGLIGGFGKFQVDYFSDHSINEYIKGIWGEVVAEEGLKPAPAAAAS